MYCHCLVQRKISWNDSGWFSAVQLVSLAPEVLVDIKTTIFYNAFCPLILRLELLLKPFKIRFRMTWLSWLSHYTYYFSSKERKQQKDRLADMLSVVWLFFCSNQEIILSSSRGQDISTSSRPRTPPLIIFIFLFYINLTSANGCTLRKFYF